MYSNTPPPPDRIASRWRSPGGGAPRGLPLQAEHAKGVLPQELRPDVVAERDLRQLTEDALEREPHREVARVHHLVRAPRVRVVDDRLRVVLRCEGARRVVEVRPLEQQLDGQVGPGLAAVAHHEPELREAPADLVAELDGLPEHRDARAPHADADEDRKVELHALGVDRVEALVVDRHLRGAASGEGAHRLDADLLVHALEVAQRRDALVGVDPAGGDEAVGVAAQRLAARPVVRVDADQRALDAPLVHLFERVLDVVVAGAGLGDVLEDVLDGELEALPALAVAEQRLQELVARLAVRARDAQHEVDDPDPGRHPHGRLPACRAAAWRAQTIAPWRSPAPTCSGSTTLRSRSASGSRCRSSA